MATDREVAKLKSDLAKVKAHLRALNVWNRRFVANNLRRLKRQSKLSGPNVTDPPRPPRP